MRFDLKPPDAGAAESTDSEVVLQPAKRRLDRVERNARTGKLKWHNADADNLTKDNRSIGVSVQGHLLFHDSKVYLASEQSSSA